MGRDDVVMFLLSAGADPHLRTEKNKTAIQAAEHEGHTTTTQILKAWQENQSKELVQKIDQMFEASQNQFTQLFEASQNQFTQLFKFQRESMTKLIFQLQQASAEQQEIEILMREKSELQKQASAEQQQIEILAGEKS